MLPDVADDGVGKEFSCQHDELGGADGVLRDFLSQTEMTTQRYQEFPFSSLFRVEPEKKGISLGLVEFLEKATFELLEFPDHEANVEIGEAFLSRGHEEGVWAEG